MTTSPPPPVLVRTVELPSSDSITVIVSLNRPEKKNCFDVQVVHALSAAFLDINRKVREQQLQQSDDGEGRIAAVILTGEGSSFSAGRVQRPSSSLAQQPCAPDEFVSSPDNCSPQGICHYGGVRIGPGMRYSGRRLIDRISGYARQVWVSSVLGSQSEAAAESWTGPRQDDKSECVQGEGAASM